jgi:hypothetical protein
MIKIFILYFHKNRDLFINMGILLYIKNISQLHLLQVFSQVLLYSLIIYIFQYILKGGLTMNRNEILKEVEVTRYKLNEYKKHVANEDVGKTPESARMAQRAVRLKEIEYGLNKINIALKANKNIMDMQEIKQIQVQVQNLENEIATLYPK